jgi:hypothetical protein
LHAQLVIGVLPVVPYRVREMNVEILRVLHTSRRWPFGRSAYAKFGFVNASAQSLALKSTT